MTKFHRSILNYWDKVLSDGAIIAGGENFSVTTNSMIGDDIRAMVLESTSGYTRAVILPALSDSMASCDLQISSAAELRVRLDQVGATLHDPDFLFYLPDRRYQEGRANLTTAPRQLAPEDRKAFEIFQSEAPEQDLEDAYVALDHWAAFGSFDKDRLVSAASIYPWRNTPLADLGVLTLLDYRGKGHACAVVREITKFARQQGYEPQYRCQLDNEASVALAKAAGFVLFGKWEVHTAS
jgi:RimJ/RimL family protein N-acetyltransferase